MDSVSCQGSVWVTNDLLIPPEPISGAEGNILLLPIQKQAKYFPLNINNYFRGFQPSNIYRTRKYTYLYTKTGKINLSIDIYNYFSEFPLANIYRICIGYFFLVSNSILIQI